MRYKDVKIGMLVTSEHRPEIKSKPGTVVGFANEDSHEDFVVNIFVRDNDGHMLCCCADRLEPVHDECTACKHDHVDCNEIPCLYCRNNALPENPFYDKLPNLWEAVVNIEAEDIVQISKNDALLAADTILRYANVMYACSESVDTEWMRELAKRLRNGG